MVLNLFNFKGNVPPGPLDRRAFVHQPQYGPGKKRYLFYSSTPTLQRVLLKCDGVAPRSYRKLTVTSSAIYKRGAEPARRELFTAE